MTPLTRRATIEYRRATLDQVERGHQWYPDAHAILREQAAEHGVTIETAAGVMAALSPRMPWGRNVVLTERMLASGGTLDHGCLGRSLAQARAIHAGNHPLRVMRGPKTRAFYEAILTEGQSPTAVIDVHAWAMLIGKRGEEPPTDREYREAARVMDKAALIIGVTVHELQATTWLTYRSRFWTPGAHDYVPRLEGASA